MEPLLLKMQFPELSMVLNKCSLPLNKGDYIELRATDSPIRTYTSGTSNSLPNYYGQTCAICPKTSRVKVKLTTSANQYLRMVSLRNGVEVESAGGTSTRSLEYTFTSPCDLIMAYRMGSAVATGTITITDNP